MGHINYRKSRRLTLDLPVQDAFGFKYSKICNTFRLTFCLLTAWGGVNMPPLYFIFVIQIYNIWYVFRKPFNNLKKWQCLQKSKYLLRNLVVKQKMCKNKCANCNNLYIFKKPLTQLIQMCKNNAKLLKPKCVFKKNENVHITFKGVRAKICAKFLCKTCAICLLLLQAKEL